MPASLAVNREVIQELRGRPSPLFFPVSIHSLDDVLSPENRSATGVNDGFQVLRRDDTNDVLAVHRDVYRLHTNYEVLTAFEDALIESGLDLTGLRVQDEVTHNGARAVRIYRFPAHRVTITEGDQVDLQLKVQNSYDASRCLGALLGGFRLLCSNGMVIGETICDMRMRHTQKLDLSKMTGRLNEVIDIFNQSQLKWQQWQQTPVPEGVPELVLESAPKLSEPMRERIMDSYRANAADSGRNLWTLYNALTAWSTHDEIRSNAQKNRAAIILQREQAVRQMIEHPIFNMAA